MSAPAAILIASQPSPAFDGPLALQPWDGDLTLVEYELAQLRAAGVRDIEVVLGHEADRVIPFVSGEDTEPVVDARWQEGVAGALRTGAAAVVRGTRTALVAIVQQPRPAAVYRALLDAHAERHAALTRPTHAGTPGWPLVVDEQVLAELRNVTDEARTIDALLARHADATHLVPFDAAIVLLEVETPADLLRARAQLAGG